MAGACCQLLSQLVLTVQHRFSPVALYAHVRVQSGTVDLSVSLSLYLSLSLSLSLFDCVEGRLTLGTVEVMCVYVCVCDPRKRRQE